MDTPQINIEETDFTVSDGRWNDVEWVEQQAEISACDDLLNKGLFL